MKESVRFGDDAFPEGAAAIFNLPDNAAGFNAVPVTPGELSGSFAEATGLACELSMSTEGSPVETPR